MLRLIVSGGQSGVDQASWRAATIVGIRTGGYMPLGFRTEDGVRPEFHALFGALEYDSWAYAARTQKNAELADATVWIGGYGDSPGFHCTQVACKRARKPFWSFRLAKDPRDLATLVGAFGYRSLNVAGPRESLSPAYKEWPGIDQSAERWLVDAFREIQGKTV